MTNRCNTKLAVLALRSRLVPFLLVLLMAVAASGGDEQPGDGVPEGYVLFEGDIVLPREVLEGRATYATNLWPGGIVPYEFDANVVPGLHGVADPQAAMLAAMAEWEAIADIDFRPRVGGDLYWLHILDSTGNQSYIGCCPSGSCLPGTVGQNLWIHNWNSRFTMAHELGHALGYWHEHSRLDRDTYIQINWTNIQQGWGDQFGFRPDQGPLGSDDYGPYDLDSVMHYDRCGASICCPAGATCDCDPSCEVITVLPPWHDTWGDLIGQRNHLSVWDARMMSFLYPFPHYRFLDGSWSGTQSGTFFEPYTTFTTGYSNTPNGGTLWVQPGHYSAVGTWSGPITLQAPLGGVTLGQ